MAARQNRFGSGRVGPLEKLSRDQEQADSSSNRLLRLHFLRVHSQVQHRDAGGLS